MVGSCFGGTAFLGSGKSGNVWVGKVDGLPGVIKVSPMIIIYYPSTFILYIYSYLLSKGADLTIKPEIQFEIHSELKNEEIIMDYLERNLF